MIVARVATAASGAARDAARGAEAWKSSTDGSLSITGAGRGQGRSHAVALAAAGADVVVTDLCHDIASVPYGLADDARSRPRPPSSSRSRAGGRWPSRPTSATAPRWKRVVASRRSPSSGTIDIVVANAGICGFGAMPELTEAQWDDMVAVNLTGVFNTFRAVVPAHGRAPLRPAGGHLVGCRSHGRAPPVALRRHQVGADRLREVGRPRGRRPRHHRQRRLPGHGRHADGAQRGAVLAVRAGRRGADQGAGAARGTRR